MKIPIEWLGLAGTALCVLGYLPQISHLIRERCSEGLSCGTYCTWGSAAVLLLLYAIGRGDPIFLALQRYSLAATGLIYYFARKYSVQPCAECQEEAARILLAPPQLESTQRIVLTRRQT
jgi:uncharacterized protein with PQ loop repeat